jgi:hypothetical protein
MNQEKNMEEIIQNHDKVDTYIALSFTIFDIILYFIIFCLFGCFNRELLSAKQKISFLIILDICIRTINIFYSSLLYSLTREILLSIFASCQFYFIITILNKIFKENNKGSPLDKEEIKYPFLSSIIFFIFAITFQYNKTLYFYQYGCSVIAIIIYSIHVKRKVDIFLYILEKRKLQYNLNSFLHNFIILIALYYIIYYILKISSLFVENMLYYSYLEIIIDIVKELIKYIIFLTVIYFYYLHNKFSDSEQNQTSVKISNFSSVSSISSSSFQN